VWFRNILISTIGLNVLITHSVHAVSNDESAGEHARCVPHEEYIMPSKEGDAEKQLGSLFFEKSYQNHEVFNLEGRQMCSYQNLVFTVASSLNVMETADCSFALNLSTKCYILLCT
jgi:hypothetical protein